ncbi:membrane-associated guanylate kinase, WW and PDZ domain-containing protein 2-like isoform X2 [Ischnura elegans]|uniref:membrane-associated guanylate kinase, WW and PDZ domain-containing protein 2-like isoform X2 n=1 Tax=Ischnura elegans TaxID=197161 RepID=UPI001ED8BAE2|nr:membrane-associated guanylate kinase, WW and PDZ domain-containing protein 2-like isoform X2 [Ischnura elegans]
MLKSGQKRPTTPNKSKSDASTHDAAAHWRQGVRETVITTGADGGLNFSIRGGSDNGEFAYVCDIYQSKIKYVSGTLQDQDVLLEIQGQKVAGYTQRDVVAWLNHCCRNGNPVVLKTVTSGTITKDLRQFLNTRFQKGSIDHDLQNTIRDNLYLRTVPVTTRSPREGEVNGVDYTFLTLDEFMALERSGNLLESGVYEGNHYGTPKPSREPPVSPPQSSGSNPNLSPAGHIFGGLFPGAHPSSEGKRKRNRSNVEAMASKTMDPEPIEEGMMGEGISNSGEQIPGPPGPGCPPNYLHAGECPESPRGDLGPLPPNWEKAYTERGEVYFIDHNSGTSHWLDPRLSKFQKKSLEECLDDELPYGWEKIDDPHYGTYYIDHVNRRTQYENPVIQAKRAAQGSGTSMPEAEAGPYPQYRKPLNSSGGRSSGSNHSGTGKRSNRLNLYLTCIPCLATEGKDVMLNIQAQHTYVKPRESGISAQAGTSIIHASSQPRHSAIPTLPPKQFSETKSPSLNQTIVPKFALPSFPPQVSPNWPYLFLASSPDQDGTFASPGRDWDPNGSFSKFPTSDPLSEADAALFSSNYLGAENGFPLVGGSAMRNRLKRYSSRIPLWPCGSDILLSSAQNYPDQVTYSPKSKSATNPFYYRMNSEGQVIGVENKNFKAQKHKAKDYERPFFTRNPNELRGERIQTTLVKSSRGLGFTIVGGDDTEEEFLQIKSKVPNGPAWLDGKLQTGDVLVYVNDTCVLGFTHHDMVSMFQSIGPNETVSLEVCRGYPLPFDPNDPNTEVVTTVAVNAPDAMSSDTNVYVDRDGNMKGENYNFLDASSEAGNVHNGSDDMVNNSVKSMPDLCNSEKMKGIQRPNSTDAMLSDSPANALSLGDFAESSSGRPEFLTISIVKGAMGFGFTIADSAYGQKVKKILDRQRCKNLMEGDILVDINNINVRNMCHSEVVQVLKDCPRNQEATVMVQRGGIGSPSKGKAKKKEDPSSPRKNVYKEPIAGLYRSKTPTADLYSTQQKEVIPNRPKTPLVDTRGRPKTPTSSQRPWTPSEGGGGSSVGASDNLVIGNTGGNGSGTSVVGEFGTSEISGLGPSQYGKGKSGLRGEGTGNKMAMSQNPGSPMSPYDPYKSSLPYPNVNYPMGGHDPSRSPLSHIGDRMMSVNLQDNPKGEYIRSHSPGNDLDGRMNSGEMDPVQSDGWNKPQGHYDFKSGEHFSGNVPQSPSVYDHGVTDINRSDNRSPSTEYYGQYISSSFFNGYGGSYDQSYGYGYGEVQGGGGYPPHKDYGFAAQGSGCNPMSPNLLGGSIPPSSSGYYTSDSLSRRKESTSFEHEQPYPSAVIRYSRDPRWPDSGPVIGMGGAAVVSSPDTGASTGNHIMPSEWYETVVTLVRQETGFGFRIVGGTEEGSQVSIGHIVPGGAADVDGRLCTGDEIVSVDGQSVLTTSHHHVVQLMGHAASNGQVTLGIRRRVIPSNEGPSYPRQDIGYPYDVSVTRQENEGFGFVIISSVNKAGSTIGRIIEGSPAERCGQLHVGDRILAVNHIDIMNLHHGDIVNLIKDSGYSVTLSIGPPLDDTSSTASASQREEEANVEEEHYHAVELGRGIRGFGFSIRGGREYQNMPLFVLQIAENGPAAVDGRLKIGDQIIEINGINTKNMTHAEAIEIIRNGGPSVRLLVRRCGKVPPPALDHQAIPSSCAASPQSSGLRPGSSLSQPGTGVLGMGQVALPSGSGANSNGPLSHSSSCEPGYWDRYAQS